MSKRQVLCLDELDPLSFALAPSSTRSSTEDSSEEGETECRIKPAERKHFGLDWDLRKLFRRKRRSGSAGGDSEDVDGVGGGGSCVRGRSIDTGRLFADEDGNRPAGLTGGGLERSGPGGDELRVDGQGVGLSGEGRRRYRLNPARFEGVASVAAPAAEASSREVPVVEENDSEDCRETPSTVSQSEERRRAVVEAVRWAWKVIREQFVSHRP